MWKAVRLQKGRVLWLSLTDSIYRSDTRTQRAEEVREWLTENEALFTQHQFTIVDMGISAACDHQSNLFNHLGMRSSDAIENARQVMSRALAKVEK
jgi:hypothetical protein